MLNSDVGGNSCHGYVIEKIMFWMWQNNLINEPPGWMALIFFWLSGNQDHFYGAISMCRTAISMGAISMGPFLWACSCLMHTRGKHPGTMEVGQVSSLVASGTTTCHMGSVLTKYVVWTQPNVQRVVYLGARPLWLGNYFWKVMS